MTANTLAPPASAAPRFDAGFIEEHRLIEQYIDRKLPVKAARQLETWCRENPGYLDGLKLAERAAGSLQLLEACGRPLDLTEPPPPWWRAPYVSAAFGAVALLCLLAFWALFARFALLRQELEDSRMRQERGALVQPSAQQALIVAPDRTPGAGRARIVVSRSAPQLIDLHLDMGYSRYSLFRLVIDKREQGRALVISDITKDSNGELRLTFNTTGLAAGEYAARIEGLPLRGGGVSPEGWVTLEVN